MSRITLAHVVTVVRKVGLMTLQDKEALADEIYRHQPHMLASCLVQTKLGVELTAVEFLLNILLVCYQAMKESGLQWSVITEDDQEQQMQRWIGAVRFSEQGLTASDATSAQQQYVDQHPEQPLLAFVINETTQWLHDLAARRAEAQSDKFVMMASMNMVNCIASARASSLAHG